MEKTKKNKEALVNDLIVLCHILKDYKEFNKDLIMILPGAYKENTVFIHKLYKISQGKKVFGSRKIKLFFQKYKSVIETINYFSNISAFIFRNYDMSSIENNECNLDYFYKYINDNKSDLGNILSVLEKIKKIGFPEIEFDENEDFTTDTYVVNRQLDRNTNFSYLDNLEIISDSQSDTIEYKTLGSNFLINVYVPNEQISNYGNYIIVNSLLFDSKRLPENISKEALFDPIVGFSDNQQIVIEDKHAYLQLLASLKDLTSQIKKMILPTMDEINVDDLPPAEELSHSKSSKK